ncbi:hypothetical protein BDY21DRAFT_387278 [Lineolata rhizophorae]|uniref:RBR-type E3 ubiquitin transferase n=1 Tax=Lineolata rhizophorae TaxID=578093 RepID=A0A6A6NSS5_9PEZI|nr:hypothetical protein BDY21DRAFT_387278 [Lineolata rhizophorae]
MNDLNVSPPMQSLNKLKVHIEFLKDRKLAQSIAQAVDTDGPAMAELLQVESQAVEDRHLALRISSTDPELEDPQKPPPYSELDPHHAVKEFLLQTEHFFDRNGNLGFDEEEAGPSKTFPRQQEKALEMPHALDSRCCSCREAFRRCDVIEVPCNDVYCVGCLKRLFNISARDMSLFPPRCHRVQIPLGLVSCYLNAEELEDFQNAQTEFSTDDKTYCSTANCGKFIPPSQITAGKAECVRCGNFTCTYCKNGYHLNDCSEDPDLQTTLALAESSGWKRCYSCRALIQLQTGCNHMTCLCSAEFCYLCGERWKSCSCPQFTERFLYERAEEVVDRDFGLELRPRDRQNRIQQVQEDLRQNHECEHPGRFQRIINGGRRAFRCEMCEARHWKYILQCRRCHVQVCQDCRRNRVR